MNVVITEEMRVVKALGGFEPEIGDSVLFEHRISWGVLCTVI